MAAVRWGKTSGPEAPTRQRCEEIPVLQMPWSWKDTNFKETGPWFPVRIRLGGRDNTLNTPGVVALWNNGGAHSFPFKWTLAYAGCSSVPQPEWQGGSWCQVPETTPIMELPMVESPKSVKKKKAKILITILHNQMWFQSSASCVFFFFGGGGVKRGTVVLSPQPRTSGRHHVLHAFCHQTFAGVYLLVCFSVYNIQS